MKSHRMAAAVCVVACVFIGLFAGIARADRPDILLADFEGKTYGDWTTTGTAFGDGPARGTLPRQMDVSGFNGHGLVNSFNGGDRPTGTLTSPVFTIDRNYLRFLIGGGGFPGKTCMNLLIDSKAVRTATGQNTRPGGHELLEEAGWDVTEFAGKKAQIQIVDNASGGWGHILVDDIVLTDRKPELKKPAVSNISREIVANQKLLLLPVKNGATMRKMQVLLDGAPVREFLIEAADGQPDWWASLDISAYRGKTLKLAMEQLTEGSGFLAAIEQGDNRKGIENLYREALRPQFHFSPARGWTNDPNGMVYYNGEYHLFFQYNPYGTRWNNMHWGHAVSKDMVHWQEIDIALYPDEMGPMFSGSAVVDWKNTSGFGSDGKPPMVLIYTAAGHPTVQGIAYSTDGRTFTKYAQNPVVREITGGNRDPKVMWHEPTKQWVMSLYVGVAMPGHDGQKKPPHRDTIHFLTSPNLKDWKVAGQIEPFHECPDLFALPVDGDAKNVKWVITAASSDYMVGQFDGGKFTAETPKLKGHLGRGYYAAQTFSDIPAEDGRRIQIGWFKTPAPGMPFNQSMSVPMELKLLSTKEGPRLSWLPVKELELLRSQSKRLGPMDLKPGDDPLAGTTGELLDARVEFEPGDASEVELTVRGVSVVYDCRAQELHVGDHKVPAPLRGGTQRLIVLADRASLEVFASDGLTFVPYPVILKDEERSVKLSARGGTAKIQSAEAHQLKSAW